MLLEGKIENSNCSPLVCFIVVNSLHSPQEAEQESPRAVQEGCSVWTAETQMGPAQLALLCVEFQPHPALHQHPLIILANHPNQLASVSWTSLKVRVTQQHLLKLQSILLFSL